MSAGTASRRVAVMQPYFLPYAGYYRLLAAADVFVIYDCVQFPRRGRVHRCELPTLDNGPPRWLTLALQPAPRDARIDSLRFAADARARFDAQLARLDPAWWPGVGEQAAQVREWLQAPLPESLADWLAGLLRESAALLGLAPTIMRSSSLDIEPTLRGEQRILAIVRAVGGDEYVNSPGGVGLYSPQAFAAAGIGLHFLRPYAGRFPFLLPALLTTPAAQIAEDIQGATSTVPGASLQDA